MREVEIKLTKAKSYRVVPVTGAWGGTTPDGDVLVDLYIERVSPPDEVVIRVDDKGGIHQKPTLGTNYERELQMGLLLRPDIAHSIGRWLINKAKDAGFKPEEVDNEHNEPISAQ